MVSYDIIPYEMMYRMDEDVWYFVIRCQQLKLNPNYG